MFNTVRKNHNISWFQTFALFWMLYACFWVIPQRLNVICLRFKTLCLFHLHRQAGMKNSSYLAPMKMEKIVGSETSPYKIQTPGNYPEASIQHNISVCFDTHKLFCHYTDIIIFSPILNWDSHKTIDVQHRRIHHINFLTWIMNYLIQYNILVLIRSQVLLTVKKGSQSTNSM